MTHLARVSWAPRSSRAQLSVARYHDGVTIRLPGQLYQAFVHSRREHQREMQAAVDGAWQRAHALRVDRTLYARLVEAHQVGLSKIEPCSTEEYDGPWPEVVLRADLEQLSFTFDWTTHNLAVSPDVRNLGRVWYPGRGDLTTTSWFTGLDFVAAHVVDAMGKDDFDVQWLEVAWLADRCTNDAVADRFEPIVARDPSAVVWHVAASLHTWAHSGVWTPSILAETLDRWAPRIDEWCRQHAAAEDRYMSFMASYATRLLDGRVQEHDGKWLSTYIDDVTS